MSEISEALSFRDWSKTIPNIGREGLVGVYLAVENIDPKDDNGVFKRGIVQVAIEDGLNVSNNTQYRRKILPFTSSRLTGAHVDLCGLPPRTFWAHKSGASTWFMLDTNSSDPDEIGTLFDESTVRVPKSIAEHGQVFTDEAKARCASKVFTDPVIFCGASGIDVSRDLKAAIHQVEPGPNGRVDFATNTLIFADTSA